MRTQGLLDCRAFRVWGFQSVAMHQAVFCDPYVLGPACAIGSDWWHPALGAFSSMYGVCCKEAGPFYPETKQLTGSQTMCRQQSYSVHQIPKLQTLTLKQNPWSSEHPTLQYLEKPSETRIKCQRPKRLWKTTEPKQSLSPTRRDLIRLRRAARAQAPQNLNKLTFP